MSKAALHGGFLMLILAVLVARPLTAAATPSYTAPTGFIVDTAHVIPAGVEQQIAAELTSYEDRTQHQMAVVVVPSLEGQQVDEYARGVFNAWGIGRAGVDDGALLLVGVKERQVRVQVGRGLANTLTNDAAVDVVNEITPILHRNDFAGGVLAGERAMRRAAGDTQLDARATPRIPTFGGGRAIPADDGTGGSTNPVVLAITLGLIGSVLAGLFFVVGRDIRRREGPGGPSGGGGVGWFGGVAAGGAGAGGAGAGGAVGGGGGASGSF